MRPREHFEIWAGALRLHYIKEHIRLGRVPTFRRDEVGGDIVSQGREATAYSEQGMFGCVPIVMPHAKPWLFHPCNCCLIVESPFVHQPEAIYDERISYPDVDMGVILSPIPNWNAGNILHGHCFVMRVCSTVLCIEFVVVAPRRVYGQSMKSLS